MQVILAEEQTLEIQHIIGELIKSEVKNARESVGADSPFLNKRQACDYLGISNKIGKSIRFNKESVNHWMARLEISAQKGMPMSIKKTKNGTYHLKVYIPNEVQPKLGLGAYYEKRFKTRREAKDAELKLSVDIEKAKLNKHY